MFLSDGSITLNFILKVKIMNQDTNSFIKEYEKEVGSTNSRIIPESTDKIRISIDEKLRGIKDFYHYGEIYHDFPGTNIIIDKTNGDECSIIVYDYATVFISKKSLKEYIPVIFDDNEKREVTDQDIREMSFERMIDISNITLNKGINIIIGR